MQLPKLIKLQCAGGGLGTPPAWGSQATEQKLGMRAGDEFSLACGEISCVISTSLLASDSACHCSLCHPGQLIVSENSQWASAEQGWAF